MATLDYTDDIVTDGETARRLIEGIRSAHVDETPINADSTAIRYRDDGNVKLVVTISATGNLDELKALQTRLAEAASELGFADSEDTAEDTIDIDTGDTSL
jgi:hypothetical protein